MKTLAQFLAVTSLAACAAAPTQPVPPPAQAAPLAGRWSSAACESSPDGKGGQLHFTRTFTITATTWAIDFSVFGDPSCAPASKLFTAAADGPYSLGAPSAAAPGATEAEFRFEHRTVTAKADGVLGWFNGAKVCGLEGWKVGDTRDVQQAGCLELGFRPAATCAGEHDLVKVDGDRLYFGARPADGDLCTAPDKRPHALGTAPVVRS